MDFMGLLGRHPPLQGPSNVKLGRDPAAGPQQGPTLPARSSVRARLSTHARRWLGEHGRKLWWLHSLYALLIGAGVVAFARRGLEHAGWMAALVGVSWLLVVLLFRLFGSQGETGLQEAPDDRKRVGFFVMTYALKNSYQAMLFFLLPFYWKSATLDGANVWFVLLLASCALLSTLDIVFDRVLMRRRALASTFHAFTLFACLNLVIHAVLPDTRSLVSLLAAAAVAVRELLDAPRHAARA